MHKPYISQINPHKLVNKTPVSCPCGVPEALRPSSIESNRVYTVYTCIPSMLLAEWSKQQAVHDDLSYLWIDHIHLWVYHILLLRTYFRVPDMSWHVRRLRRSRSHRLQREDRKQKAGSQLSPDAVRGFRMIPRQQVQTCDLLWFMVDNDGEWWTMMDNDVDCV